MVMHHQLRSNLPYTNDQSSDRTLDLYLPLDHLSSNKPYQLLVYVHGGAWRSGDKAASSASGLIENLSRNFPTAAICSVNYRLSTASGDGKCVVRHPSHNEDVTRAIEHLSRLPELSAVESTFLIGHSVGAFICLSIGGLLESPISEHRFSSPLRISGLVLVDGIYDLPNLLEEYPSYSDFVAGAFGEELQPDYLVSVSPLSWPLCPTQPPGSTRVLVIHSRQDSLLTTRQPELACARLQNLLGLGDLLEIDFDSVTGDHEELLLSPQLATRIHSFITRVQSA